MVFENPRKHEVQFCAEVSKWADHLFEVCPTLPFGSSDIESFGRGSNQRQDLRFYERKDAGRGRLALCGEVKLPGTAQGRSPFDVSLMQDAFDKATRENCRYFFTWNVEELALFDRSRWDAETMHERCIGQWNLGLELNKPSDVTRAEVGLRIQNEFLPRFFANFAEIWLERRKDFNEAIPEFYISVLESLLAGPMGPVRELRDYLGVQAERSKIFDARLRRWMVEEQQWNFDRTDPESWRRTIDRAARSMVYVLNNRILFYQAVRLRNQLPELAIPKTANTPDRAMRYLRNQFQKAVEQTGDYEPVFFPDNDEEWAAMTALSGTNSIDAWQKLIRAVDRLNFKEIPTDILGHIFQKLISPEERHKFGQHYTEETIVDVINAFCIRKAEATVLDPACGSGSFLVRAYYRKSQLDRLLENHELLAGLYGCDINPFPAHLATLNLAARDIKNEENYPRIVRRNFFTVEADKVFCTIPKATRDRSGNRERGEILLPSLDAIVGNPPYVRQELIPRASQRGVIADQTKEHIYELATLAWPGIQLSKQSDLHVYFWPVATQFLKEGGYFGFLTSSSWFDARYGFPLQRWILRNFRLIAIIESVDEPWFEDARVKTAVTIIQRCKDEDKRSQNLVRFVRLNRPLADILGSREDEGQKQDAAEKLRDLILNRKADYSTDALRIMVKRQSDLWEEGVTAAAMFAKQKLLAGALDGDTEEGETEEGTPILEEAADELSTADYGGGKWGRFLRAPNFYFDIMREFGKRFVRLGEIATIRFGIKSGCDAFFMPRNVSATLLDEFPNELAWANLPLMKRCKRADVKSGKLIVVKCGDGTLHPLERTYVRPEVHSLMQVDRPIVTAEQLDRAVLWVNQPLSEIKGTYAYHYITWGSRQTFASTKSKSVPVPQRSTCAGRPVWYDLTGLKPGIGFWPMAQQYRHFIPENPNALPCNHRMFDIHPSQLQLGENHALLAILNSTLVALFKNFYGRYTGTEGSLDTEVFEVLMIEIPDPRSASAPTLRKLQRTFKQMQQRATGPLLEEKLRACRSARDVRGMAQQPLELPLELLHNDRRELDDAVFEVLGVTDAQRRSQLVDRLYSEVALHNRQIRIVEVQKMEQRRHGVGRDSVSASDLAFDAWRELDPEWRKGIPEWLSEEVTHGKLFEIPEGQVRLPEAGNFFEATTVFFGKKPAVSHVCDSRAEAELIAAVASTGTHGPVSLPTNENGCAQALEALNRRIEEGKTKMEALAAERAGSDKLREQLFAILFRWFTQGFPKPEARSHASDSFTLTVAGSGQ
jgi:methylase of polypeptide subunit release factors